MDIQRHFQPYFSYMVIASLVGEANLRKQTTDLPK